MDSREKLWKILWGALLLVCVLWAYFPLLSQTWLIWGKSPDYSHGYLVAPISLGVLWYRRGELDLNRLKPAFGGIVLLVIAGAMRLAAGRYYIDAIDGWSFVLSIAGAVSIVFGWSFLWWCWPSVFFLIFMFPLPYSVETALSLPLQKIATIASSTALRMLGQPAVAEGTVVYLAEQRLDIERACAGLRIFFGITALAYAYAFFVPRSWWERILVLFAVIPIAIAANVLRIVTTGVLYRVVSTEAGHKFSHDISGWLMVPIAAAFFWLFLKYLDHIMPVVEITAPTDIVHQFGDRHALNRGKK